MTDQPQQDNLIKVYDFFSGCGGTSAGLRDAGMDILLGIDFDRDAARTFKRNFPSSEFICDDITNIEPKDIEGYIERGPERKHRILFTGCAPCQPFSVLNRMQDSTKPLRDEQEEIKRERKKKEREKKEALLLKFIEFIEYYLPDFIFVENVPGFQRISNDHGPYKQLLETLDRLGYFYPDPKIIEMQKYGVPQRRKRLVIIASRLGVIDYPRETHDGLKTPFVTVYDKIGGENALPEIKAGEKHPTINIHQSASLSDLNLRRIRAISQGQNRLCWSDDLKLTCHKGRDNYHTDVYGRLFWNELATGLTTRCISLSNGRFGHPEQDRAISAREAARLQTFKDTFFFEGTLNSAARQIGNAVPVRLAYCFGKNFVLHNDYFPNNLNG